MQNYQLDFLTPGILPSLASSRKQIRHRSKSRIYPRLRPQRKQRFVFRVLNFGTFRERAMTDVFAIIIVRPARYISLISRFFSSKPAYGTEGEKRIKRHYRPQELAPYTIRPSDFVNKMVIPKKMAGAMCAGPIASPIAVAGKALPV